MIPAIMDAGHKNGLVTASLMNPGGFWTNAWKTGSIYTPPEWIKSAAAAAAVPW